MKMGEVLDKQKMIYDRLGIPYPSSLLIGGKAG